MLPIVLYISLFIFRILIVEINYYGAIFVVHKRKEKHKQSYFRTTFPQIATVRIFQRIQKSFSFSFRHRQ